MADTALPQSCPQSCDILIRGADLIDGSGAARRRADVAIRDDRILAVGDLTAMTAGQTVEGSGLVLAPGFIDVHTHDDFALLNTPEMTPKVSQGVTTVVVGNCGVSLAPLAIEGRPPPPLDLVAGDGQWRFGGFVDFLDGLDKDPASLNAACLTGHSTLRVGVMDRLDRPATEAEIAAMRDRLAESLEVGSVGFSTGLNYPPAVAAPTEEIIGIAKALTEFGALYCTHMRDEGEHVMEALDESFLIGRETGAPVVISHHKVHGIKNFGRSPETLRHIDAAAMYQPVALDVYPYTASSTVLLREFCAKAQRIMVSWSVPMPSAQGRDLEDVAAELGCSVDEAIDRLQPAGAIYFSMDEEDVRGILSHPRAMIGSDGLPNDTHPHPRLWGTFPRVLGHYCRDLGLFELEEAVRRMTAYPAERFGLKDRGMVREGAYADLVLFDADTILDKATFDDPKRPAEGIALVMVNGRAVWRDGAHTGDRPGRALRRGDLNRPAAA